MVKQKTAKTMMAIKIVTGFVLLIMAGIVIAAVQYEPLRIPALVFVLICLYCYLRSPIAFEISNKNLLIHYRWGRAEFPSVESCQVITERPKFGIRVFGNGGFFAGTGIFWSKRDGFFRAYVTASGPGKLVWVVTKEKKIMISPENPNDFVSQAEKEI